MPLLTDAQRAALEALPPDTCPSCARRTRKNYCRQCDWFFYSGHDSACPELLDDDHRGHRTY